jgi:hypothetical protein
MKSRHVLSTTALLLLTGPAFALCKTGSTAICSINGKPGTRTCLGSGRFGPCVTSPQTNPTGPAPPANYIGEANDPKTVIADSDTFFAVNFGNTGNQAYENQAYAAVNVYFQPCGATPPYWELGQQTSALVQMYDLLLPLDSSRAKHYLDRLHTIAAALLANRDDHRQVSALGVQTSDGHPIDAFRNRVMKAWGAVADDRDNKWNTDVSTTGLFTYALAALARRVTDNPAAYPQYATDAIQFTTAALESYAAFQPEQHLIPADPWAYFTLPLNYKNLQCADSTTYTSCSQYREEAGEALAYNENLSMMKALAEAALAADSALYRNSADVMASNIALATNLAPLLIAKNFTYYDQHLTPEKLSDGTPIFTWQHQQPAPSDIQNIAHGGLELGALAVLLDDKIRLNALLAKSGQSVQVALSTPLFTRFANTFLRKIWHYDFQNASGFATCSPRTWTEPVI